MLLRSPFSLISPSAMGLALVFGLATGAGGCEARALPRRGFACTCQALTDTDLPTDVEVTVCVSGDESPESVAEGRASTVGHMPVRRCACTPSRTCDAP